ncbi:hypothetical protein [Myroides sp. DW712]|uniref:hypothetical protein n=1 Tax=Myroides sp. DW712 TaxID=3389800 RepID=UPI0039793BD3
MSIQLNKIGDEIIKVRDCNENDDFIGIGIELDDSGEGFHSGIIISLGGELTLFHFDGTAIYIKKNTDIPEWFYIKKLDIFEENENFILNFKAHCELISEEANPEFGFVFDGSYYSNAGEYYTESNIKDITTCVGFCIKIIKGYLYNHNDYLSLDDWNAESMDDYKIKNLSFYNHLLEKLEKEYPDRFEEIKRNYFKRIMPSDLTTSGFYNQLPIRKSQIDQSRSTVEMVLKTKRLA